LPTAKAKEHVSHYSTRINRYLYQASPKVGAMIASICTVDIV